MSEGADRTSMEEYLKLPYTISIVRDGDSYVAKVAELPGCVTQAETRAEATEAIDDAMRLWLESALAQGLEIPKPRTLEDYSGRFVVRMPSSLHRRLSVGAEREGVSLNQYAVSLLSERSAVALILSAHPYISAGMSEYEKMWAPRGEIYGPPSTPTHEIQDDDTIDSLEKVAG